jgi:hypothetical protein
VNANGTPYEPAPNTVVPIPGVGSLTLNEQYTADLYRYNSTTGDYDVFKVIYVFGAHLRLLAEAEQLYGTADVIIGFTSCDPLVLPNLSGLKLGSTPSD